MIAPLVAAAAGAAARTTFGMRILGWAGSTALAAINNPFKTAIVTGAAAHYLTDAKSTEVIIEGTKSYFKDATGIDPNKNFDLTDIFGKFWDWLVEKFSDTASLVAGGATLLGMYSANGGMLWKATVGAGVGLAAYFGYKHFFPQHFNTQANPPGLAMKLEAKPETEVALNRTAPAPARTTTTSESLTGKAKKEFEMTEIGKEKPQTLAGEKETKPEVIIDEPGNEPA